MSCCHGNDTKTREGEKITNSKCKIKRQLLTGVTLKTKRPLTPKDIADLEADYARLEALVPSGRILGRIRSSAQASAEFRLGDFVEEARGVLVMVVNREST